MRQWLVNPKLLCKQHLLGEHVEAHMFVGTILKKINIKGYIDKGLVEVETIPARHEELVVEMERRGIKHKSPLPVFEIFSAGKVDRINNIEELKKRCSKCKELIEKC